MCHVPAQLLRILQIKLFFFFFMKTYNLCLISFSDFVILQFWSIGNRNSCLPMLPVIIFVIYKWGSYIAVVQFVNHLNDYRPNWTPLCPTTIINPLHLNISMYILHNVLYTFPKVLMRRSCLLIKRFLPWWPFPLF